MNLLPCHFKSIWPSVISNGSPAIRGGKAEAAAAHPSPISAPEHCHAFLAPATFPGGPAAAIQSVTAAAASIASPYGRLSSPAAALLPPSAAAELQSLLSHP